MNFWNLIGVWFILPTLIGVIYGKLVSNITKLYPVWNEQGHHLRTVFISYLILFYIGVMSVAGAMHFATLF